MQDVRLSTPSPRVGDAITATINVRNTSSLDVTGARVTWTLQADGGQVGRGEFTVNVKANSLAQVQWRGTVPNAKQLVLNLTTVCANDANPSNNAAAVSIVAFVRKLPSMTPSEYQALSLKAPPVVKP